MEFRRYTADQRRFRGGLKSVDGIIGIGDTGLNDENRNNIYLSRAKKLFETVCDEMNVDRKERRYTHIATPGFEGFPDGSSG